MVSNPSNKVKSESIDEVILRLLGLNVGVELDYQTYHDIIKKKLAIARLAGKELPREEDELLRNEFKRVRSLKDKGLRFKIKKGKTKVGFTKTSSIPGQKKLPSSGAIIKAQKGKLAATTNAISVSSDLETGGIKKTLDSILTILSSKFKFDQKQTDKERREKETEGRGKRESTLEGFKKGIGAIVSTTKKLLSPFQAIIDRIFRFIFFTLLGRGFTSFMEWMSNKENQKKFDSFIEFLSDHWPALAGLYILFGTSFGKLVRGLMKAAVRMTVALIMNIGKIKAFAKKYKGLVGLGIGAAAFGSGRLAEFLGENKETPESGLIPREGADLKDAQQDVDKIKQTPAPRIHAANLGGIIPKFNLGGMIPGFAMGGFNSYGGMDFQQGVPITGAGPDDTLIAARRGEAILTEEDQRNLKQQYGVDIPQYLAGRKPGSVSMSNLRFPGFGGGFNLGGIIPRFNKGGVLGGGYNRGTEQFGEVPLIRAAMSAGIKGPELAAFLAQMSHETGQFKWNRELGRGEGMGYSGGSRYHGRGYTQLTHDYNYKHFGKKLGVDLVKDPDLLLKDPNLSARVAIEYWKERVRPKVKNWNDIFSHSAAVNFPSATSPDQIRGYEDRVNKFNYYLKNLNTIVARSTPKTKPENRKKPQSLFERVIGGIQQGIGPMFNFGSPAVAKPVKKEGGGLVKENAGMNLQGATADRQAVFVQPGEYVLPLDTVTRLGGPSIIDRLVAMTDSNSTPFKQGVLSRPQITPYKTFGSGMDGMMTLPPMVASGGGSSRPRASGLAGSSEVPDFSAVAPSNNRAEYAAIYGLRG